MCKRNCEDCIQINEENIKLVEYRSGSASASEYICASDFNKYIKHWAINQLYCSDPFNVHKKKSKYKLRDISLENRITYSSICTLVPGSKLCKNCLVDLDEKLSENEEVITESQQSVASTGASFKEDSQEIR